MKLGNLYVFSIFINTVKTVLMFSRLGNWDSKFKLAETSCLQLIEWDLNPGLPNSDVRMVSGNVSTKEGLSPLAFKTSNSQKVSQPFPASLEQGLAGCYNLSICCVWLTAQLCPTLCDPMDGSPPGSSVHWILQARLLEWVAIPSSRGSSQPRDQTQFSRIAGRFFRLSHQGSPMCHPS